MESRQLKRDIEALLGDYIGQKLRENGFDPKGKGASSMLDDLAHYDLAISVALWWLNKEDGKDLMENFVISPGHIQYPNRAEREAMILSSFAGLILNSLPVEDILCLYNCKPSASYAHNQTKSAIIHPFALSYHPFAMLGSYKAVDRSRKHNERLKRWKSIHCKAATTARQPVLPSPSRSSASSFSDSGDSLTEKTEHYEGSQESLQD
ncbi:hypothetical protein AALO_G00043310 [Alosa alosa]|uniref:Uncharacterized protein n=1 Tax=Alosa alosa TaxID=278164 RepID=A0AAV6HCI9_9TELE|nr:uncharacterized protein C2orf80-like isoform X3 [Alosa alosa]KAG5283551.1 hypothetical protein AALO_G00043310 [Alosa alosa]